MLSIQQSHQTQVQEPTFVCTREGAQFRDRLERNIKQGFAAAYDAKISQFMPLLCELNVDDVCVKLAKKLYQPKSGVTEADFVTQVLICLYHSGIIGIKVSANATFLWSHIDQPRITRSEVRRANQIKVHKMLRHALEIKDKELAKSFIV